MKLLLAIGIHDALLRPIPWTLHFGRVAQGLFGNLFKSFWPSLSFRNLKIPLHSWYGVSLHFIVVATWCPKWRRKWGRLVRGLSSNTMWNTTWLLLPLHIAVDQPHLWFKQSWGWKKKVRPEFQSKQVKMLQWHFQSSLRKKPTVLGRYIIFISSPIHHARCWSWPSTFCWRSRRRGAGLSQPLPDDPCWVKRFFNSSSLREVYRLEFISCSCLYIPKYLQPTPTNI